MSVGFDIVIPQTCVCVLQVASLKEDGMMAPRTLPEFITLNSHAFARGKVSSQTHFMVLQHDVLEAAIDSLVQNSDDAMDYVAIFDESEGPVLFEVATACLKAVPGPRRSAKDLVSNFKSTKSLPAWQYDPDQSSTAFQCEGFSISFTFTALPYSGTSGPAMSSTTAVSPLNYPPHPADYGPNFF